MFDLNSLTGFTSLIFNSIYVFYGVHLLISTYFIYRVFNTMPKYGFSKESSLDVALLAILTFSTVFLLQTGNVLSLQSIYSFYLTGSWFIATLASVFFISLACKVSAWSVYKVLDIFSSQALLSLGLSFLVVYFYTWSLYFLFAFLLLSLSSYLINKSFNNNFSTFIFFKLEKPDEYSFIGASFLLSFFMLVVVSLVGFIVIYNSTSFIIVNSLLLFFIVYLLVKRSRKFNVVWHIQKSLYKNKKESLNKKEHKQQQRLID